MYRNLPAHCATSVLCGAVPGNILFLSIPKSIVDDGSSMIVHFESCGFDACITILALIALVGIAV